MSTRRRSSRLKTAEPDADSASQAAELLVNLPSDISVDHIKQFLPEDASLESPTPDVIIQLYRLILDFSERAEASATELDEVRADAQRKEVEMEQTVVDVQNEAAKAKTDVERLSGELRSLAADKDALGMSFHPFYASSLPTRSCLRSQRALGTNFSKSFNQLLQHKPHRRQKF